MTASFVGQYDYNNFCRKIKTGDSTLTVDKIIEICNFLNGKYFDDNGRLITNALNDFIYQIIKKAYYEIDYPQIIKDFIKTDYYSNKVKSDIFALTKNLDGYDRMNKMLLSDINMNDFDLFTLNDINDALYECIEKRKIDKDINVKIPIIFRKYMFALDGVGPVDFIINNYTSEELGKEFLINSGLVPHQSFYKGKKVNRLEFNEEHLILIYKFFDKYMLDKKENYVEFIKRNEDFNASTFIANYLEFIENDFSCESITFYNNIEKLNTVEWEKVLEEKANNKIKNLFFDHVNKDKKELKKTI